MIPTLNERKNLETLVGQLTALLDPELGDAYELIVVDDDSKDLTWERGLELMATHPKLRVMRRQGERGLSSAVIRGWQVARGEVLAVIDADLQHPPEVTIGLWRENREPRRISRSAAVTPKGAGSATGACCAAPCRGGRSCSASCCCRACSGA